MEYFDSEMSLPCLMEFSVWLCYVSVAVPHLPVLLHTFSQDAQQQHNTHNKRMDTVRSHGLTRDHEQ